MNKGKCKNCGGDEAIHRWDTLQCPFGGREAPFPRKTEYINSYYVEDDSEILAELATLRTQRDELVKALEAAEKELIFFEADEEGKVLTMIRKALAKVKGDA